MIRLARRRFFALVSLAACAALPLAAHAAASGDRIEIDLSGPGWSLWLDRDAEWKNDELFFPPSPLESLPVNPPSGGWASLSTRSDVVPVSVPATVEEYLQKRPGPEGDLAGVSWWVRTIDVPARRGSSRVLLRFESLRLRAEIFVNRRLVGYDAIGNTPVEVDITSALATADSGGPAELAVRITDPGGNFDWRDSSPLRWSGHALPLSHGFGGITGRVRLVVCDPVYVDDIFVQNTPAITEANAIITVRNTTGTTQHRDIEVRATERTSPQHEVFHKIVRDVELPPGDRELRVKIFAPGARVWDLDSPHLHVCEVRLRDRSAVADTDRRVFGFRWFAPENVGTDAVLRLNGRRIVLRSAISWGFWPINGITPTEELAEKQIRAAKAFGLNMLNFHRAIGNPIVLEKADELGLLYYEEPGAYKSVDGEPSAWPMAREKLLRMVRRDRSHPSLVAYNLINEWNSRNPHPDPAEIARHLDDMRAAHQLDPSRVVLHTSAWARGENIDDPAKLHFRPFDDTPYWNGWYDVHHAGGPATWNESLYRDPTDFYLRTENVREVVFWGEEGAISTPPRLGLIDAELAREPRLGWDGAMYREWHREFESFLDRKGLRTAFPTVDSLTSAMGAVSLYHQGRRIENVRMSNVADGYAINGWEAQILENHSGVVDCFRNPKSDPAILAYFNQPLYVAVTLRNKIAEPGADLVADFWAVNERDLKGEHRLRIALRDDAGRELASTERIVTLTGGEAFGELLAEAVALRLPDDALGRCRVEAVLVDRENTERARGRDEAWVVDWRSEPVAGAGAVWESGRAVQEFLRREKSSDMPAYHRDLGRLDWIVAARAPSEGEPTVVPTDALAQTPGGAPGLKVTFFRDPRLVEPVHQRVDGNVALSVDDGAAPDPALPVMTNFGVRWEGVVTPTRSGRHVFSVRTNGRVSLIVNGTTLFEPGPRRAPQITRGEVELQAGVPAKIRLEFVAASGAAQCELGWVTPDPDPTIAAQLLERVRRDGTTLVVLERADAWMALLAQQPDAPITYRGAFRVGKTWLGGIHFVGEHPLFDGLPVNTAMDWPYQAVVRNGDERLGLLLEGEDLVAGCWHSYPMQLGTAVGIVRLGRGRVVFSTLDIVSNLNTADAPASAARRLLVNFLASDGSREKAPR